MTWIRPPETVRRFTLHQLVQHWIAVALWFVLAGSVLAAGAGAGGIRPLHAAAGQGKMKAVAALLEFGADVNAKDKNGWTALIILMWPM